MRQNQGSMTRESDERYLEILHLSDSGLTARQIAGRVGGTKSAIIGALNRIWNEPDKCACVKPENRNGGQPQKWWSK